MSDPLKGYLDNFQDLNPWARLFDVRIEKMQAGCARLSMPFKKEYTHSMGVVQGGVITALADAAVAHAITPMLDGGEACTTVELKINFLAPVTREDMIAEARVIKKGRQIVLGEADVVTPEGKQIARVLTTFMIIRSRKAGG
ncbi:MAG: PaaI family thioesterase [Myxococcota bacterium]